MNLDETLTPLFARDTRGMQYAQDIRINGKSLQQYGVDPTDGIVRVGEATPRASSVDVPGRAGSLDLSLEDDQGRVYEDNRTIEFDVVVTGDGLEAIESKRSIAALNGMTVTLEWGNLPGHWVGRCKVGAWKDTFIVKKFAKAVATITLDAHPYLIGRSEYFTIDTDGRKFWVRGDRPSPPIITTVPPSGTKRLYVTVNQRQLVYNLTGADGVRKLVADCDSKLSTWAGNPVFPSIDSDYPILVPGFNTATITAGSAQVVYTQRIMV